MYAATRELYLALRGKIEVGQIHGKEGILVLDRRTQKLERPIFKSQNQPGKMPGLSVIEAVLQVPGGKNIAVPVEHTARVAILENARPTVG